MEGALEDWIVCQQCHSVKLKNANNEENISGVLQPASEWCAAGTRSIATLPKNKEDKNRIITMKKCLQI